MEEQPNYYAIIPASVRYNQEICANAKLLYGEITALTHATGFCWATNDYFAGLYNVSERSIRTWLESLEKEGFIKRVQVFKDKNNSQRIIKLLAEPNADRAEENFQRGGRKLPQGAEENFHHNNTVNNTLNKSICTSSKNKETIETIISYFNTKTNSHYRPSSKYLVKMISARLQEGYSEQDFLTVIDKKYAEWNGDEKMERYLVPETLFAASKFEKYLNQKPATNRKKVDIDYAQRHTFTEFEV